MSNDTPNDRQDVRDARRRDLAARVTKLEAAIPALAQECRELLAVARRIDAERGQA